MKEVNQGHWQILEFHPKWLILMQSLSGGRTEKHISLLELSTGGVSNFVIYLYVYNLLIEDMMIITTEKILDIQNISGIGGEFLIILMGSSLGQMVVECNLETSNLCFEIGLTYFFKDGRYWRFNDYMVITERELPRESSRTWFGC